MYLFLNNFKFQNVTDEDSMVVQHILAVRKGTREGSSLNKDDKNSPSDSEGEIKKEHEEVENEEKSDEKSEKMTENLPEVKSTITHDEKSDTTIKTEQAESETNEKTEQNLDETEDSSKKNIEMDEYYVKYRNFSYLHCEWKTEEELLKGDKRIAAKLKRFKQKMANNTNIFENVSCNYYNFEKKNVTYIVH